MQPHIKNYLKHFNYTTADVILCERCKQVAVDIHHIIPRSKFGSKRKEEQDNVMNLIALCRDCHTDAHAEKISKDELFDIIKRRKK